MTISILSSAQTKSKLTRADLPGASQFNKRTSSNDAPYRSASFNPLSSNITCYHFSGPLVTGYNNPF
jgi:hypothetical protein